MYSFLVLVLDGRGDSVLFFPFFPGFAADGVGHGGLMQSGVIQVRVDLGGVQIAVAQNLLERTGVYSVFSISVAAVCRSLWGE